MVNKKITVFEHSKLRIDEQGFTEHQFNALIKFNELHGNKYFTPGFRKIIFNSYVGVIQAGDRVIEILPKADNLSTTEEQAKVKWQSALLYMLKIAGYIKLNNIEKALQQTQSNNLLDIYIYTYLKEVASIIHAGLVKKYHQVENNGRVLKGRLLIENQIKHNIIHKERFFTEHTIYDRNNIYNAILKAALEIIHKSSLNYGIKQLTSKHLLHFEGVNKWIGQPADFIKLRFDRKTKSYEYAIELARMIILHYSPNMAAGNRPILAILFDMNRLFEKYIYSIIKKEEKNFTDYMLHVKQQNSKPFWGDRPIRPDITIEFRPKDSLPTIKSHKIIIDTKWKIISAANPSDDDLKQMYAYNLQFGAANSILLYPSTGQKSTETIKYAREDSNFYFEHGCRLYFANLFKVGSNKMNERFGYDFLTEVLKLNRSLPTAALPQ